MQDKAIEFEAIKFKTLKTLQMMKSSGLNVSKYENVYENIINDVNTNNKTLPESIVNSNTSFATDCLSNNYANAISKLNLLLNELNKYDVYIKVAGFTNYLKLFLEKENKTTEDFSNQSTNLIEILNKLLTSDTLDYDVEGNIIEDMYAITYEFIKEELVNLGYSKTLDYLKNNETNLYFLEKKIIQELETINLKDKKYLSILTMKKKIESEGLNCTYASEEFITLIATYTIKNNKLKELVNELNNKINSNLEELTKNKNRISWLEDNRHSGYYGDLWKNIAMFVTSAGLLAGLIFGSIKLSKYKEYNNTTTTYSKENGITMSSEYQENKKEKILVYEYTPYQEIQSSDGIKFTRTGKVYDVTSLDKMDIASYLDLDFNNLNISPEIKEETEKILLDSDKYEEIYRYVTEIAVDKEDYENKFSGIGFAFFIAFSIFIDVIYERILYDVDINEDEIPALISAIIGIVEESISIIEDKKDDNTKVKEIKELNKKAEELIKENKELIQKLLNVYETIKDNPNYKLETEKINKTLKLIKKKEQ